MEPTAQTRRGSLRCAVWSEGRRACTHLLPTRSLGVRDVRLHPSHVAWARNLSMDPISSPIKWGRVENSVLSHCVVLILARLLPVLCPPLGEP